MLSHPERLCIVPKLHAAGVTSYTVGMTRWDLPELIIRNVPGRIDPRHHVGMQQPVRAAAALLTAVAAQIIATGAVVDGDRYRMPAGTTAELAAMRMYARPGEAVDVADLEVARIFYAGHGLRITACTVHMDESADWAPFKWPGQQTP
jgi:hypothetical protein